MMATQTLPAMVSERKAMSGPALHAFFQIMRLWGLTVEEQMTLLGISADSTFSKWQREADVVLPKDTLERISCVIGIYKALQILLPNEKAADEWVMKPNTAPPFGGQSALDRMLSGQVADLLLVRQYLDAECGG